MAKRNSIEVKLIRGNHRISNSTKPDIELYKSLVTKGNLKEELVKPALVISRVDYPIDVEYGGSTIRVSPRAKLPVADMDLLGDIEKGLVVKKLFKNQPIPKSLTEEKPVKKVKKKVSKKKSSKKK